VSSLLSGPETGPGPDTGTLGQVADGFDAASQVLEHGKGRGPALLSGGSGVVSSALDVAANGGNLISKEGVDLLMDIYDLAKTVKETYDKVNSNHECCKLLSERIQVRWRWAAASVVCGGCHCWLACPACVVCYSSAVVVIAGDHTMAAC
jgi:hypothetical protein